MKRIVIAVLYVVCLMAVQNGESRAEEIRGQVAEKTGESVRIATTSDDKPRVGDKVEIFVLLPDQGGIAVVATGRVEQIRSDGVIAKIERATGAIKKGQFARILSAAGAATLHEDKPPKVPEKREAGLTPEPLGKLLPIIPTPGEFAPPASRPSSEFAGAVNRYQQALFKVGDRKKGGSGTAFVISRKHRLLATNAHVADIAVDAILNQSRTTYKVIKKWYHPGVVRLMDDGKTRIRSTDPADGEVVSDCPDLAILQLEAVGADLPAEVTLASLSVLRTLQGEDVGMIGYPGYHRDHITREDLYASATFVKGTVSRLTGFRHDADSVPDQRRLVQFSARTYPGFSGSPVFLRNGQVVIVSNHVHFDQSKGVVSQTAYGIRVDALWELLKDAGLADSIAGAPERTERTTMYRPQSDDRVEKLRAAKRLCHEAIDLSRHGDFTSAINRVDQAIRQTPDYWRPYWRRALVANHLARGEHSHMSANDKLAFRREVLANLVRAGALYQQGHRKPNVRVQLDVAREQINLARLTGGRSYYNSAIKTLSDGDVLKNVGNYADYLYALRGSVKLDLKDLSGALQDLNNAIRRSPDSADYYRTRAGIWRQLGQTAEAARDRQRYKRLHHEWMKSHNH